MGYRNALDFRLFVQNHDFLGKRHFLGKAGTPFREKRSHVCARRKSHSFHGLPMDAIPEKVSYGLGIVAPMLVTVAAFLLVRQEAVPPAAFPVKAVDALHLLD